MSKKKARMIADELEFDFTTSANTEEIFSVLDAAAASVSTKLKGKFSCAEKSLGGDGFRSTWEHRGPGGMVKAMVFTINGKANSDGMAVQVRIQAYAFQKAPLPGMKPTLNSGKQFQNFRSTVLGNLAK